MYLNFWWNIEFIVYLVLKGDMFILIIDFPIYIVTANVRAWEIINEITDPLPGPQELLKNCLFNIHRNDKQNNSVVDILIRINEK